MNSQSNSNRTTRLSPSQRLTRSLSTTAHPLATSPSLNRLLTFTNARSIQPGSFSTSQSHLSQTPSSQTSFSTSLNPSSVSSMMFLIPDITSSISTANTTISTTIAAHSSVSQLVSNIPVFNSIAQSSPVQPLTMDSTTPMLLDDSSTISSFHHSSISLPLRTIRLPMACRPLTPNLSCRHYLDLCEIVCRTCHALH